jgi:hypothetical protein
MPAERIAMRQVRDVLRLKAAGVSGNEIARRVGVASSTVRLTLKRLASAGLSGHGLTGKNRLRSRAMQQQAHIPPTQPMAPCRHRCSPRTRPPQRRARLSERNHSAPSTRQVAELAQRLALASSGARAGGGPPPNLGRELWGIACALLGILRTEPDVRHCRVALPLLTFAPTEPTVLRYRSELFRTD